MPDPVERDDRSGSEPAHEVSVNGGDARRVDTVGATGPADRANGEVV
jgi:hypothetical protein